MKIFRIVIQLIALAAPSASFNANANIGSCSAGLTTNPVQFESALTYHDTQSKANPAVQVWINGKPAKMVLDSGSNSHSLWDESLLDEMPNSHFERLDAIAGSADARRINATLTDSHGNALRQEFYLLADSALREDGYSGILSPQAIAGSNAVIIDFERNCFFTSPPFGIDPDSGFHIGRGTTIQNPHDVMAISVELDGRDIPVIVDSGATNTIIQASLLESNPKGRESPRMMDIFKAQFSQADYMRLADLNVNGQTFKSLPVIPRQTKDEKVILNFGYIGMDVLKERVIYYHGAQREFVLLTRQDAARHPVNERNTRIERHPHRP